MAASGPFGNIGNVGKTVTGAGKAVVKTVKKAEKKAAIKKGKASPKAMPVGKAQVVRLAGSKPVTLPGPNSRGILATDNYGRQIVLAGPMLPDGIVRGKPHYPQFGYQGGTVDVRDIAPKLKNSKSAAGALIGTPGQSVLPGHGPKSLPPQLLPSSGIDPVSATALKYRRMLAESAGKQQGDSDALLHWVGNTYSNFADSAVNTIHGIPAASLMLLKQFGPDSARVFIPGASQGLGDGEAPGVAQVNAAARLGKNAYNMADAQAKYDWQLGTEFVQHPLGTINRRGFDLAIAAVGAASGVGAVAGTGLRSAAALSRYGSAVSRTGSLAGGVRVMRGEKAALLRPGPYRAPEAYTYKNAAERRALAEKASAITGNHIGGSIYDMLQRVGDKATKSILPGSPRHRPNREIAPPTVDARGREIGMTNDHGSATDVGTISVARGPRSSNPITRSIQQHVVEPITNRVVAAAEVHNVRGRTPFMHDSYTAAAERKSRAAGYSAQEATDHIVLQESNSLARQIKKLRGSGRKNGLVSSEVETASAAAALHSMGVTEPFQGSHTWGRDNLVSRMQDTLNGGNISRRDRKGIEQQMKVLQDIPDAWLGQHPPADVVRMGLAQKMVPEGVPKKVQDLAAEHRRIYAMSSDIQRGIGAIDYQTEQWSKRRTQAQLIGGSMVDQAGLAGKTAHVTTESGVLELRGARPLKSVRTEAMGPVFADRTRAAKIATEITARTKPWKKIEKNPALSGYTTDALRTMQKAYERRSTTLRRRVIPRLKVAEHNALQGNALVTEAARRADEARQRVRELSQRRTGEHLDQPIADARAERTKASAGARFDRNRAGDRARMTRQGDVALRRAAAGRLTRKHAAELEAARAEVRRAEAAHKFEVDRAKARAGRAVGGSRVMNDARTRRARMDEDAVRRDAAVADAAKSKQTFNTGVRKGQATERLNRTPETNAKGQIPAGRSRTHGMALRADGRLYVVGQRSGAAIRRGKDAVSTVTRKVGAAAGARDVLSPKARAAIAEHAAMRGEGRGVSREAKPAYDAMRATERRHASERAANRGYRPSAQSRKAIAEHNAARGELRGIPAQVRPAHEKVHTLRRQRAAERARPEGSLAQIRTAEVNARKARKDYAVIRQREAARAFVDANVPEQFGMKPGEYFPHRPARAPRPSAPWHKIIETGGPSIGPRAAMAPAELARNEGKLIEQGNISLAPSLPSATLRQAVDAQQRTRVASGIIEELAVKSPDGRAITGKAAEALADSSGGVLSLITKRQLARISSLSNDTPEGQRLVAMMDAATKNLSKLDGDQQYLVPTGVIKGWTTALGPAGAGGRTIDYLNSLWKGGVLALSPRWYFQNMIGMWGQFAVGAGADLQAISMAKDAKFTDLIPGRISASGLSDDMGEYARRLQGQSTNPVGALVRGGFNINATFEAVPRRAMFWSAAKRQLKDSDLIGNGPVQNARVAQAWLDVAHAAAKGDPGANAIIDQSIRVTERFMGNYSRYNALEKNFLRRVFPFYAWMRSIHRLVFALPIKHPKRTALMVVASQMAYALYGLERGKLYEPKVAGGFVGNRMIGTGTLNPPESVVPTLQWQSDVGDLVAGSKNLLDGGINFLKGEVVGGYRAGMQQAGPLIGLGAASLYGATTKGIPLRYSPGFDNTYKSPTGRDIAVNPRTGETSNDPPTMNPIESVFQSYPLFNTARRFLADGTPYSSASTLDLIRYAAEGRPAGDAGHLVTNDPKYPRTSRTDWKSMLSSILTGTTLDLVDPKAARLQQLMNMKYAQDAWKYGTNTVLKGNAQAAAKKKKP